MSSMIKNLGKDYFDNFFNGALLNYNGHVVQVQGCAGGGVIGQDFSNGCQDILIPENHFTGFGVFAYPLLGYRRFGDRIGYATKKQSVHRGLRCNNVNVAWTAATRLLVDYGALPMIRLSEVDKALALFNPKFDTLKDVPDLLAGKHTGLVLSQDLIIEPSTEAEDEWYSVIFKQAAVGKVDGKGVVTWKSPQHQHLLPANLVE